MNVDELLARMAKEMKELVEDECWEDCDAMCNAMEIVVRHQKDWEAEQNV